MSDTSNEKTCCICLDDNNNYLIEYNHCGLYYVHESCLNDWNPNECIICRKKIIVDVEIGNAENIDSQIENSESNNNNLIAIVPYRNNKNSIKCCISFCFVGLGIFFLIKYII